MSTISILALALVIYLFGGYLDKPTEQRLEQGTASTTTLVQNRVEAMMKAPTPQTTEPRLSLWFALLSPLLGVLTGAFAIFAFAH